MRFSVHRLQLDDVLPGTPFPVVLAAAQQQPGRGAGAAAAQPLLAVTVTSVLGGARGRSYMPLVAVRRAAARPPLTALSGSIPATPRFSPVPWEAAAGCPSLLAACAT
jgi:hypothetical protein